MPKRMPWAALGWFAALLVLCYAPVLQRLVQQWSTDEDMGHGFEIEDDGQVFGLRPHAHRLRRTHGDFHPFNIVFQEGPAFRLLDASRGSLGDPADDVAALCINFPFFALEHPAGWERGLGRLYHRFFDTYQAARPDDELYEVIAPFLAFRALVVCNPRFYPALAPGDRDRLLHFIEEALDSNRFDPASADILFHPGH